MLLLGQLNLQAGKYVIRAIGGAYNLTGGSAVLTNSTTRIVNTVYSVDDSGAAATTQSVTITGVTSGSVLVAFVGHGSLQTITGVSDGTSYTAASDGACIDTNNNQASRVYFLPNASSGSHTVVATFSGAVSFRRLRVIEIVGLATSSVEDRSANQWQVSVGTTTDSISSSATATTTNANNLVLGLTQDTGNLDPGSGTLAAGTGFTLFGTNLILGVEGKIVNATGAQTATFTDTKNSNRTTHVLALKRPSTGPNNYILTSQGGSYSISGGSAILKRSNLLTASGGSYSLTGQNAKLVKGRVLTAQGGSYALTGQSANLLRSKKIVATGGVYNITGQQAILSRSKYLIAQGGTYSLTGGSAIITWTGGAINYTLICQGGSYTLLGASVGISRNRNLTSSGGSYTITGGSATLLKSKTIQASGGAYTLTGSSAVILKSKVLVGSGGSYVYSGQSAVLKRSRVIQATGGSYTLTGSNAVITWSTVGGAVYPPVGSVLLGVTYGPTGTEYTGTLDIGKKFRIDIATGNIVMIIDEGKVMSL